MLRVELFIALLLSSSPLVKRPKGTYKTLLSLDGGGTRNIITVIVLVEVEHAIKRHLLSHPELLPHDSKISSPDDFDIHLADYFDIVTGNSAGGWLALYLASRGGKGVAKQFLNDPSIVKKYGVVPDGSIAGLIVLFREFGGIIYPPDAYNLSAGVPLDLSNPSATGVSEPIYANEGVFSTMEKFMGDLTMNDLDTSVVIPALDLITGYTILFVRNVFGDVPMSASAVMLPRGDPRLPKGAMFRPDLQFTESDYFLTDVATASSAAPIANPAYPISPVGSNETEFLCIDGVFSMDSGAVFSAHFTISENGLSGFEDVAMMSIAPGGVDVSWANLANAGYAGWADGLALVRLSLISGRTMTDSLLDYAYYSNPKTKPYQYLRIEDLHPITSEIGFALSLTDQIVFFDLYDTVAARLVTEYRQSIDIFVRDFIFG